MSHVTGSRKVPRRNVVTWMAMLGLSVASHRAGAAELATAQKTLLADKLAAYADGLRYADLDPATVERVNIHLIDTIGCGIAAFDERVVRACRDLALSAGNGNATVIGTRRRTSPDLAAFANCAAFRYYDLNDVYVGGLSGHPSDLIAPVLAVAEVEKASAEDLITAIALAYEVSCRLIDTFDLTARGWDVPVFSLPAVALAAGKLMKLSPAKLAQAVNIALNDHIPMGQTRAQTLSDWKGLADAEASRNAVFATLLARSGLTGPSPIFEGRLGFFKQVSGEANVNIAAFGGHGNPFRINNCGIKPYPAVIYSQTVILAALAVAKDVTQGATDKDGALHRIAAIEIATTRRGYQQAGSEPEKWTPKTRDTADHSLPYIAARAMFDGDITNASYTPEKLSDPRILAFMSKIKVAEDPALTARTGASVPARITATMPDGKRISHEIDDVPGFPGRPLGRADVERKFRSNIGARWPRERVDAMLQSLWGLDRAKDIGALLSSLTV
jgi:2-methylcitrate dehydratase